MVTVFPSAVSRSPDLFNLEKIHKEVRDIEELVIDQRLVGLRETTINTTDFTDTTIATAITFDSPETGTANFATNTEAAVTPGNTLQYNGQQITYEVQVDGTSTFADTDTTIVITSNGNLVFGGTSNFSVALTTTMTLDNVVTAINNEIANTGIRASTQTSGSNFLLRLAKDNTTNGNSLIIDATSTAQILTDLGFTSGTFVIDINDVATQTPDGTVDGTGPFNLQLTSSSGIYIIDGTALTELGLTQTVNLTNNTLRFTGHSFTTGQQVELVSVGNLPIPLNSFPNSFYYVIVVDTNTISLATTNQNALNGTSIDLTAQGDNVFSVKTLNDSEIYFSVWKGLAENTVYKQRMDEVIEYFEDLRYVIFRQDNEDTNSTFRWVLKW